MAFQLTPQQHAAVHDRGGGLLVSAETEEDNRLVYRMTAYSPVQTPCPSSAEFSLPDGEILHKAGG